MGPCPVGYPYARTGLVGGFMAQLRDTGLAEEEALSADPATHANELLARVRATAEATPNATAYRAACRPEVTYGQLWADACKVARALRERTGGRAPVIVYCDKSALAVASFLGCLLSGHAFVPVDCELPTMRVHDIASQIERPTLLACVDVPSKLSAELSGSTLIDARAAAHVPREAPVPPEGRWVRGEDTNYIIFTSGSTGRPKGIEVSAANVQHFMHWLRTFPVVRDGHRVFLDQAHYSFDLSEYELVGALSTGGCLHAVSDHMSGDYRALFADLAASDVEVWVSTPSFADFCLVDRTFDGHLLPKLRLFLFCGEELRHATAAKLRQRFPHAIVANTYGPTESTVAVTYAEIDDVALMGAESLPVGRAREGTELRILDQATGAPLAPGATGEIVIIGDTVAKGYYGNPEKTAEVFFDVRRGDGTPVRGYHTGDVGHLDEDGTLFCEGRMDSLVKLNGFRIELGEIEGCLEQMEGVSQAVVVPTRRSGRVYGLRAYVVLDQGHPCPRGKEAAPIAITDFARAVKRYLGQHLPGYMVPRTVRVLDQLPLTANGKVDRAALAARKG